MPKIPSKRWWMRVLLGVVWTPIAAEIFLRWLAPVPMLPRYIEAGPHGVRANMASITYRHQTPEYTVRIRTNSQGMRADRDFSIEKPQGVRRIAILGDSFGMGYGVNLEESSLFIMGKTLEKELGCPVEVLNFSVSGFGPAEELVVLKSEVLRYQPDLVIQYYSATDPNDDIRSGLFRLDDDALVPANSTYLPAVKIREFLFSFPMYRWMASESHLYNLARDQAGTTAKQLLAKIRSAAAGSESAPAGNEESTSTKTMPGGVTSAQWLTLKILEEMRGEIREAGSEFLILSIPARRNRTTFFDRFPYSEELPFEVVTPLSRFEAAGGEMLYWERSHGHWTPLGCRLVAESLVERILDQGLLKPCR